jgi:hypothetical protein
MFKALLTAVLLGLGVALLSRVRLPAGFEALGALHDVK